MIKKWNWLLAYDLAQQESMAISRQRHGGIGKKNNPPPYLMPWPVTLTILTLALASAGLVFLLGWAPWHAFLMVGIAATVILAILVSLLLILSGRENRAENWRAFTSTFQNDLDQVLKYFLIRKR